MVGIDAFLMYSLYHKYIFFDLMIAEVRADDGCRRHGRFRRAAVCSVVQKTLRDEVKTLANCQTKDDVIFKN